MSSYCKKKKICVPNYCFSFVIKCTIHFVFIVEVCLISASLIKNGKSFFIINNAGEIKTFVSYEEKCFKLVKTKMGH